MRWLPRKNVLGTYVTYLFIGLLFAASVCVLIWATLDIQQLRRSGVAPERHYFSFKRHEPSTVPDPSFIESWMTFGYINRVFNLPPTFLQEQLGIADSKYPTVQIARYARKNSMLVDDFVSKVRQAVGQYKTGAPRE